MKSQKSQSAKSSSNKYQLLTFILIGIAMAILGAVTSFAVTKSLASEAVLNQKVASTHSSTDLNQKSSPSVQTSVKSLTDPKTHGTVALTDPKTHGTVALAASNGESTPLNMAAQPPNPAIPSAEIDPPPAALNTSPSQIPAESSPTEVLAKITHIQPKYSSKTTSYLKCRWVARPMLMHYHRAIDGSGMLLGGVTGGILGHQVGGGTGNVIATIGGTVLGAMAGNQVERDMNRPEVHYYPVRVCKRHYEERQILQGYNVTYSYNGIQKTTFMKKRPQSDYIKLALSPSE